MAGPKADSLRALSLLTRRLRAEFEEWIAREGERAPRAARELARLAIGISEGMAGRVSTLQADLATGQPVDLESIVGLSQNARFVEQLHDLLDHSTYATLHPVLSPTVRHELNGLGLQGSVLATGTRDASYEILTLERYMFESLAPDSYLNDTTWPIRIFRVPHPPLDWPLHHVLIYHELGHAAYRQPIAPMIPPELDPPSGNLDLVQRMQIAQKLSTYLECMKSWIEEVFADTVGVLLAGPSYAIAFSRFLCTFFPLDVASRTHPPIALRIELIGSVIRAKKFDTHLSKTALDLLNGWASEAAGTTAYKHANKHIASVADIMVRDIRAIQPELLAAAENVVTGRAYDPAHIIDDSARGRLIYEFGIPSIEAGSPGGSSEAGSLEPSRIFSAAWMAYLHATSIHGDRDDLDDYAARIAEALLGSLDGADAFRAWERAK